MENRLPGRIKVFCALGQMAALVGAAALLMFLRCRDVSDAEKEVRA